MTILLIHTHTYIHTYTLRRRYENQTLSNMVRHVLSHAIIRFIYNLFICYDNKFNLYPRSSYSTSCRCYTWGKKPFLLTQPYLLNLLTTLFLNRMPIFESRSRSTAHRHCIPKSLVSMSSSLYFRICRVRRFLIFSTTIQASSSLV